MHNQLLEQEQSLPSCSTILLVHYGDNWLRGSEHCLINLCKALKQQGFKPVVWCNTAVLYEALKACNTPCHCSPMSIVLGYQKSQYNIGAWYKQVRIGLQLIKQYQPALVHINSAAPCQWMLTACALTATPNITQLHAHYGTFKDRLTLGLHFCSSIMGVSHAAIRALEQDGVNTVQTRIILPNAIDAQALQQQKPINLKQPLGLKKSDILLLSVGSLIKRKGHRFLLDTLHALKNKGEVYFLAVIGDGEELAALKKQCAKLGLSEQVFFLGNQENAFGHMLGDADALVSTAIDEVFGLVLAEANLACLPVIAPNIKGINSVIKHKQTGTLYSPHNSLSLQRALLSLRNKPLWQVHINKGHYRAMTTFNSHKHIYDTVHAYEQAINIHRNRTFLNTCTRIFFALKITARWAFNKTLPTITRISNHAETSK